MLFSVCAPQVAARVFAYDLDVNNALLEYIPVTYLGKNDPLAVQRAGDAWKLCDDAVAEYSDIQPLAAQIKAVAKTVADSARTLMGG